MFSDKAAPATPPTAEPAAVPIPALTPLPTADDALAPVSSSKPEFKKNAIAPTNSGNCVMVNAPKPNVAALIPPTNVNNPIIIPDLTGFSRPNFPNASMVLIIVEVSLPDESIFDNLSRMIFFFTSNKRSKSCTGCKF